MLFAFSTKLYAPLRVSRKDGFGKPFAPSPHFLCSEDLWLHVDCLVVWHAVMFAKRYDLYGQVKPRAHGSSVLCYCCYCVRLMKPFTGFCKTWDRASACECINCMLSSFVTVFSTTDGIDSFALIYFSSILYIVTRIVIWCPSPGGTVVRQVVVRSICRDLNLYPRWTNMKLSFQKPATWNHWRTWMNMAELALALSLYFPVCPSHPFGPRALDA